MTKVEQYASQIPLVLRQTYKAFASDNRSAIVIALYNNNKRLSFNELRVTLDINQRVLTDELKKLMSGAVVDHYTEYRDNIKHHSYYELTEYGTKILKATMNVLIESYGPIIKSRSAKEHSVGSIGYDVNLDELASTASADSPFNSPSKDLLGSYVMIQEGVA